jgi:SAM-dependent methyltransferase
MEKKTEEIKAITMPGVHSRFLKFFKDRSEPDGLKILDVGAGEGALTQKLQEMGHHMWACDLFPDNFKLSDVKCDGVDITSSFPYPEHAFDRVIAVEVTEHILDHETFFSELNRILKPGGKLYISTPNVLSMKSRLRFLSRGFLYSFNPLEMDNYNGRQHVASINLDQYNYLAIKHGFGQAEFDIDGEQRTSRWLRCLFFPHMFFTQKIKGYSTLHNQKKLLLGRLLFMVFQKETKESVRT